jgi:uncharacterized protein YjiS (DUF1127 family)
MILSILTRAIAGVSAALERRRAIHHLSGLNDQLLRDIGIERHQIANAVEDRLSLADPERILARPPAVRSGTVRLRPGSAPSPTECRRTAR